MKTLILLAGLPRSGKSTWAIEHNNSPVVNPDSIRLALHGQRYAPAAEPFVWAIAKCMVRSLFLAGHTVAVLDACNVTERRRAEWSSPDWQTELKVFNTPLEECLRRAEAIGDAAIIPVIERMALEWDLPC